MINQQAPKILLLQPTCANIFFRDFELELRRASCNVNTIYYSDVLSSIGAADLHKKILRIASNSDYILLFLTSASFVLQPSFISSLNAISPVVLCSLDDDVYGTTITCNYLSSVSLIVSPEPSSVQLWKSTGVPVIRHYFPRLSIKVQPPSDSKKYDVTFIGNLDVSDRRQYIEYLLANGVNVNCFGAGSNSGFINDHDYKMIIRQSRINLSFSKVRTPSLISFLEPWRSDIHQVKGRVYEVFSLGSFCLSEWTPSSQFESCPDFTTFRTPDELLTLVKHYLSNPHSRITKENNLHSYYVHQILPSCTIHCLLSSVEVHLLNQHSSIKRHSTKPTLSFKYLSLRSLIIRFRTLLLAGKVRRAFSLLCFIPSLN